MAKPKQSRSSIARMWMDAARQSGMWLFAALGIAGVTFLLMLLAGTFSKKVDAVTASKARELPANMSAVAVRSVTQPRFESAVGSIEPIHESSIASKILAKVEAVNVNSGQIVAAGDILVQLNDDDLKLRLKQAEAGREAALAQLQQAIRDLERARQLIQSQAISAAELELAATTEQTTRAMVDQLTQAEAEAKVLLAYATIVSPYAGVIVEKSVQAGDTVLPGQTLLTLYDPDQMQLVANVRESLAIGLHVGQQVAARLETLDHECLATVREVVPQADPGSRSFQVKVSGPCPPGIYSGMFGRLLLPLGNETITLLPKEAIQQVGQLTLVDVIENGQLLRRNVKLGRILGNDMEVLAGLAEGELVAVARALPRSEE